MCDLSDGSTLSGQDQCDEARMARQDGQTERISSELNVSRWGQIRVKDNCRPTYLNVD